MFEELEKFVEENVALIIAIIPGIAASIALYFNKKTHDKEVRNQNYGIIEKLDQEFQKIEARMAEIYEDTVKKTISKEVLAERRSLYKWDFIRFHNKMAYLTNKKLIPKYTASLYKSTFEEALGYLEGLSDKERVHKTYTELYFYCNKNNIAPYFKSV